MKDIIRKYFKNRPNWRVINGLVILISVLVAYYGFQQFGGIFDSIKTVLTPFIGGFIIAFLFNPLVTMLQNRVFGGKLRGVSAFLVILIVVGGLFFAFFNVIPTLGEQLVALGQSGTQFLEWIAREFQVDLVYEVTRWIVNNYNELLRTIPQWFLSSGVDYIGSTVGVILTIAMTAIISVYMLIDYPHLIEMWVRIFPVRKRKLWEEYIQGLGSTLRSYIGALGLIICIGFTAFAIILSIFQVPNAIPLALVINLLQVIPIFGTTIGLIFVVIVTLPISVSLFVKVMVTLLIYVQFESNFIQPKVYGRAIKVHDLLILLSLYVGSTLFGFFGVFFAVPGMVVILHTFKYLRLLRWRALRKQVQLKRAEQQRQSLL